jgi:hypothetical protein
LEQVRGLLATHPDWSRYRLSCELCRVWNWRSLTGQIKDQYLYWGYTSAVGQNVKYLVRGQRGRDLPCLLFGAAAWKTRGRDAFVGWTAGQRQAQLQQVANNSRLLILPWVRAPELASHLLGRVARRIAADWQGRYGHEVALLETFVERGRFRGWRRVGQTLGRALHPGTGPDEAPAEQQKSVAFYRGMGHDFACEKASLE